MSVVALAGAGVALVFGAGVFVGFNLARRVNAFMLGGRIAK